MTVGPGQGSAGVEIFTTATSRDRWDTGLWDGDHWATPAWQGIDCQVLEAEYQTGAATEAGVLSVPEAGQLDLRTYDPERLLDPLATASPYFGSIRPGTPVRLVGKVPATMTAWTGFLDEVSFDLGAYQGRLRAIDGIATVAQAQAVEGLALPNTLRARVRAVIAAVGLLDVVPVSPEIPDIDPDPAVAPHDGKSRSAWEIIQDAALDALTYVWLDPAGTIRFTPWGSLPDATFAIGCDDGTGGAWLAGLDTLEVATQAEAVRNSIRAWASANTFGAAVTDLPSIRKYGERRLDAPRIVPNASTWAARILADRADAGLAITLGELRPYTESELALLLQAKLDGPQAIRVRDDEHGELVDLTVAAIGGAAGVSEDGWRFHWVTMIPRAEWDQTEPPPVIPPEPPVQPYHTETRIYVATSDALLALTSGGAKYGAGAATSLPVGTWSGWTYRGLVQFPAIPWTGLRRIVSATLQVKTTTQVRVGFGSSPTIELHRITGSWSAGSATSPSGSNAVVWPGPAVASANVRANTSAGEGATVRVGVTSIVLPWATTALGGSLAAQRGLAIYGGSGSGSDTTEFWPVEQGGTSRPQLELVVEVFD